MNPFQTENIFTEDKKSAVFRRIGWALFVLAIAAFLFAYFGAPYFADGDFTSKIVYVSLSVFLGVLFSGLGLMLILTPNRKLQIDSATRKIFLETKIFRTSFEEFSFAEVEKIDFVKHDYEDGALYLPQITFRGGRIIEIPSDFQGSEKYQTEIYEQVKNLLER